MFNINLFYTRIILVYLALYMVNMNLNVFVDWTKSGYCIEIAEETDAEESEKTKELTEENEYKTLMDWLVFLKNCESAILEAKATKCFKDDFMIVKQKTEGDVFELTNNFFDMLDDLEQSYEQIYLLMLTHKIVSAGIEEDEEMTYKEKETEAIRRVVEA